MFIMEANTANKKSLFMKNNNGIALIVVLLVIAILGLLAAGGIYELDYNVINAGEHQTTEYAQNISNSGISILSGNILINGGSIGNASLSLTIPAIVAGDYYLTTPDNGGTITNVGTVYPNLTVANLLSPALSQSILGNPQIGPQLGFEYMATCWKYTPPTGSGLSSYYYYTGFINVISQDNANSKLVETGANFNYMPTTPTTAPITNGPPCNPTTNPI